MTQRVFLGTGLIGAGLAEAALGRGEKVTVWNRTRAKAEPLAAFGATVADSAAEAVAGQTRVHLALTSDAAVDAVAEAITGALADDAIVIDHSTNLPEGAARRAKQLAERGVSYLHVPVFMSPTYCREAKGMMLACGPKTLFDAVEAELERMTGRLLYLGEAPDLAATMKLVGNGLLVTTLGGLADVLALAGQRGVKAEQVMQMLEGYELMTPIRWRGALMTRGELDAHWTLEMARKDVRLMLETAGDAKLAVLPALAQRMDALIEEGEGQRDVAVIGRDSVPRAAPSTR